ncbi:MAG: YtxH domain-containing protein [Bryobacterales bacterium]|nr:YtxH domain-containing protein [Acidobacteriota bacterium]MCB9384403.1 YtxH domain-containing protein [Bryobacterales bacterium]
MADSKIAYFLLGIGVGATAGILYAPAPGQELRSDLRRRAGDGRDYVRRRGEDLRQRAGDALDKGRGAMSGQRDQLAAALEAGRRAYQEATGRDPAAGSARSAGG